MQKKYTVTHTIDFGEAGEEDCMVTCYYGRGVRPSGEYGPPENYDPGSISELCVVKVELDGVEVTGAICKKQMDLIEEQLCYKFDCEDD